MTNNHILLRTAWWAARDGNTERRGLSLTCEHSSCRVGAGQGIRLAQTARYMQQPWACALVAG